MTHPIPELTTRQLVLGTLGVLATGLTFWLLYRFNSVAISLFVAFVFATAIGLPVNWLEQRGLSRRSATFAVFGLLLALISAILLLLVPLVVEQSAQLSSKLPTAYENVRQAILQSPNDLVWRLGTELPEELELTLGNGQPEGDNAGAVLAGVERLIDGSLRVSFTAVVMFLLSFYWVMEGQRVKLTMLLVVPYNRRPGFRAFVDEAEAKIGAFVAGQAALSLTVGVMALVAYLLIGLPYAVVLAILAGLLEIVPLIGPPIATIPAVIVALSQDPVKAIWVVLAMAAIQQVENGLLVPPVMRRSLGIHPVVTLLALMAFGIMFGVVGAVAAIPLMALVQLMIDRHWIEVEVPEQAVSGRRDRISRLQYQAHELTADARRMTLTEGETVLLGNGVYLEEELEDIASELVRLLTEDNGEVTGGDTR